MNESRIKALDRPETRRQPSRSEPSLGGSLSVGSWIVLGLAVIAAYKFLPDLVRYVKIERM
jgi:hypothetical protein